MAKFRGTVRKNDLEGGHWQLEAEDGTTYVLEGTTGAIEPTARASRSTGPSTRTRWGSRMTGV
jgi:hypothetical protein